MHFPSYDTIYSPLSHSLGKRYISRMSRCTCILSGHALTSFYTTGRPKNSSILSFNCMLFYITVTLPAYRQNRLFALYFIIFLIIGKFFFVIFVCSSSTYTIIVQNYLFTLQIQRLEVQLICVKASILNLPVDKIYLHLDCHLLEVIEI